MTMKKTLAIITCLLTILVTSSSYASAQLRIGLKVGVNLNTIKYEDGAVYDWMKNKAGFTGGVMMEYYFTRSGIGMEADALISHRAVEWGLKNPTYLVIPLYFKWKINIPTINRIVRPFLGTGPEIAFALNNPMQDYCKTMASWNFAAGLELFRHLQLAANYGMAISSTYKELLDGYVGTGKNYIDSRSRVWTLTLTYLF